MEWLCRAALASLALFAASACAGSVHREPVHLRAAVTNEEVDAPIKAALETSISNFALASPWSAAAQQKSVGAGDKKDKKQGPPVQVQVEKKLVDGFVDTLSKGCGQRFTEMLHGKGPQMQTFGSNDIKATESGCAKLNGGICATQAKISQDKTSSVNGRSFAEKVIVKGDSCLPKECMDDTDLRAVTNFMYAQAKSTVPGDQHSVQLQVDCSKSGGAKADVGMPESDTPKKVAPKPAKSGSRSFTQTAVALSVVAALNLF